VSKIKQYGWLIYSWFILKWVWDTIVQSLSPRIEPRTEILLDKFPWQVYLLVSTVNKVSLTSLPSRVYDQQVFLDKFIFSCVRSTKFFLTSLPSRVYDQQVFLDKFTFSCLRSTSFPWQVYLLVSTVNKVFFDKFTFSCLRSTKFFLTSFIASVHGMFLNIYLMSRQPFVCQNHIEVFLVDLSSFLDGRRHEQSFLVQKLAWLALEQGSLTRKNSITICKNYS
jgi:hypothetical protein